MKKSSIFVIICVIVVIAVLVILAIINANNNGPQNIISTSNISADIFLNNLSFNGIKIDEKIAEYMKHLVLDNPSFKYEYNNVCINTDSNDIIKYLAFFSATDSNNNILIGMDNINITYNNVPLKTIDDFKSVLGEGTRSESTNNNYYIRYYKDGIELSLFIKDNSIYNVVLEEK